MVDRSYLTGRSPPPGAAKLFLDQKLIPALIDAAGCVEQGVERTALLGRRAPLAGLALGLGAGLAGGLLLRAACRGVGPRRRRGR